MSVDSDSLCQSKTPRFSCLAGGKRPRKFAWGSIHELHLRGLVSFGVTVLCETIAAGVVLLGCRCSAGQLGQYSLETLRRAVLRERGGLYTEVMLYGEHRQWLRGSRCTLLSWVARRKSWLFAMCSNTSSFP